MDLPKAALRAGGSDGNKVKESELAYEWLLQGSEPAILLSVPPPAGWLRSISTSEHPMTSPLSYNVDEATCAATVTYHAQPTIGEWRRVMVRVLTHAAFQPHFAVLFDRRRIYTPAETNYMNQFVQMLDEERSKGNIAGRCAIIVNDPASYGMGRMVEQLSSFAGSIRTFYSLEDAEQWVAEAGLPSVGSVDAGVAVCS
jgi:hypothetical protein